jgi:DNA-binding SARP family transcriptional activator/tetratricopeptide (TPR) repeat protein
MRIVLARLLVDAGHRVSVAALVEELWGANVPADAERTARSYVSRLRRVLRPEFNDSTYAAKTSRTPHRPAAPTRPDELLVTLPGGYELRAGPEAIDARRFEQLAAAGRRALDRGQAEQAERQLATALQLWRGDAYLGFDGCPAVSAEGLRLDRLRLGVIEDRMAAALAVGSGVELIGELEAVVRANPLRERLWALLMVALYRSGRQAEALSAFREARDLLVDTHGVEPSPDLVEVHHKILNQDPSLAAPGPEAAPTTAEPTDIRSPAERVAPVEDPPTTAAGAPVRFQVPVPAQLPVGVRDFTGRRAELARLDALLAHRADSAPVIISAVSGTAGVGKTSLAIHWAHQVADRFPDGQLYVDLRGFAPGGAALDPAEALRRFIEAFGVPAEQIPAGVDARAALYRTVLNGKRVLVVLDNARDAEQVRPLLPGSAGSMAVVTSRTSLAGLVVAEGAYRVVLDVLTPDEAREMLASRLGPAEVAAGSSDVDEIIARCARLPLALAIASARPGAAPARLVAELRATAGGLDAFELRDDLTNVKAVFSWSYQVLSRPAARLFRLLGGCRTPDVTEAVAASLSRMAPVQARACLHELVDANLLSEHTPGRFACHDLLRAYAVELGETIEAPDERAAAARRVVDHYVHTAFAADRQVYRTRPAIPLDEPSPGTVVTPIPDEAAAWDWLEHEQQGVLAAQRLAAEHGWAAAVWQLAWGMSTLHHRRGRPEDLHLMWRLAVEQGDPDTDAHSHAMALRHLAEACARMGHLIEAEGHLQVAVELAARVGACDELAQVHRALARTWSRRGDDRQALHHAARALDVIEELGVDHQIAGSANAVGWYAARLGEFDTAQLHLDRALDLARRTGDRLVEGFTLHSLSYLAQRRGRYDEALALCRSALTLARTNGDRYSEATALDLLGDSYEAVGDREHARHYWQLAAPLCEVQGRITDTERIRAKLDQLDRDRDDERSPHRGDLAAALRSR